MASSKKCCCPCHSVTGVLIALFGLSFLLKTLGHITEHVSNIVWPSILILVGLKHATSHMCKCCNNDCH